MAVVPGSGARITPVFNDKFEVDSVIVEHGGSGYDPEQPPLLKIGNCGQPIRDAVLRPVIANGKIIAVRVLDGGEGYDPLRIEFTPQVPEGEDIPDPCSAKVNLNDDGSISYIQMINTGNKQYYPVTAEIKGAVGGGATVVPISQTVTGISLLNAGRNYETDPFLSINGGGGTGAFAVAEADTKGIVSSNITISNPGNFYQTPPYILLAGGGGIGAKAEAVVYQGEISEIRLIESGVNYTSPPKVIFGRQATLKRVARNRQLYNATIYDITGITRDVSRSDNTIYVSSTEAFDPTGVILLEKELIRYTGKDENRFIGCTRGINFRYDQRIVLDSNATDPDTGISGYQFNIGDRIARVLESASSKIAIVYDWIPTTAELFVSFIVDELAFIDAGSPGEKSAPVFDGGAADASNSTQLPHNIVNFEGGIIYQLTNPLTVLVNKKFEDILELDGLGDGYPDLINTGTAFEGKIGLDAGNETTLYGIEETVGGQNTTLFVQGDQIRDSSSPYRVATVTDAGLLNEGVDHKAYLSIKMDTRNPDYYNGVGFIAGETIIGTESLIEATVVSWDPNTQTLIVEDVIPYNTGDPEIGFLYEFSQNSTVIGVRMLDNGSGYASAPNVTIPTSIVSATATSALTSDQVTSIEVQTGGYGYEVPPIVTIDAGSGIQAIAQAILGGEIVTGSSSGGSWRIESIDYTTAVRNDYFRN